MEEYKDISWSVEFDICVNGEEQRWSDLDEYEQRFILKAIENDNYSGLFTTCA